jgi:hypothetical protein
MRRQQHAPAGAGKFVPQRLLEYLASSARRRDTRGAAGDAGDDVDDVVPRMDSIRMAAVLVADLSGLGCYFSPPDYGGQYGVCRWGEGREVIVSFSHLT